MPLSPRVPCAAALLPQGRPVHNAEQHAQRHGRVVRGRRAPKRRAGADRLLGPVVRPLPHDRSDDFRDRQVSRRAPALEGGRSVQTASVPHRPSVLTVPALPPPPPQTCMYAPSPASRGTSHGPDRQWPKGREPTRVFAQRQAQRATADLVQRNGPQPQPLNTQTSGHRSMNWHTEGRPGGGQARLEDCGEADLTHCGGGGGAGGPQFSANFRNLPVMFPQLDLTPPPPPRRWWPDRVAGQPPVPTSAVAFETPLRPSSLSSASLPGPDWGRGHGVGDSKDKGRGTPVEATPAAKWGGQSWGRVFA